MNLCMNGQGEQDRLFSLDEAWVTLMCMECATSKHLQNKEGKKKRKTHKIELRVQKRKKKIANNTDGLSTRHTFNLMRFIWQSAVLCLHGRLAEEFVLVFILLLLG